ncbi:hypothetical protein FAIPA1_140007 [Frankia sp. AiPs1]|uniref:hypothetical protein n=1 Tax=Frankia sp. AiPa1 TaxID=573492 RepID=UPI00202B534C|nr:hypothetical protein [Frankia sp. AiPa1]MCL9758637.1 hypothetical protein [Frankia sp. AiPa1]
MNNESGDLVIGSLVEVPLGDGDIWRFGWITEIDGERLVVDLGRDGHVTTSLDQIRRL